MGIDHTAFVAYGAKVTLSDRLGGDVDQLDTWLGGPGKDLGLGYVEWGSRCYGGDGGFVVGDRKCMRAHDFGSELSPLEIVNPPQDLQQRLNAAIERGAPFSLVGDGIRWWVGGHTW